MSEHIDAAIGPDQQAEISLLIEQAVTPLREQIAEQAKAIDAMDSRIKDLERRLPAGTYLEPTTTESLLTPGGIMASLTKK